MSACEGVPSLPFVFVFGVRAAEGWVERSTSSGSSLVFVGAVAGVNSALVSAFELRNERGRAYPAGSVCRTDL